MGVITINRKADTHFSKQVCNSFVIICWQSECLSPLARTLANYYIELVQKVTELYKLFFSLKKVRITSCFILFSAICDFLFGLKPKGR